MSTKYETLHGFLAGMCGWSRSGGCVLFGKLLEHVASAQQWAQRRIQDDYLASLIDVAQLGLMLKAVQPELIPDWFEVNLVYQAEQLDVEYANSALTGHALRMIVAYFDENNLQLPQRLHTIFQNHEQSSHWWARNSEIAIAHTFEDRLANFHAFKEQRGQVLREPSNNAASDDEGVSWNWFDFSSAASN
jgi:hypothetical protein